jgi:hypothetical protein
VLRDRKLSSSTPSSVPASLDLSPQETERLGGEFSTEAVSKAFVGGGAAIHTLGARPAHRKAVNAVALMRITHLQWRTS